MGIFLAREITVPTGILLILLSILITSAIIINSNYRFSLETIFGAITTLLFVVLGSLFYYHYNKTPEFYSSGTFVATVIEAGEEKPSSYKSILKLDATVKNDSVLRTNEQVLVYFEKTEKAKQLKPGNTILFQKAPALIKNYGNPYEFDYKSYLSRKKIYRQIYLPDTEWIIGEHLNKTPQTIAEKFRNKLLTTYRKQHLGEQETEILSALTLGYKRGLDPETKRIFSSAGAMHVLAVSGLHVGIIFAVFTLIFGFIRKLKYGKFVFVLLAILVLWSYAFITGLSPSVMRAATMFSLVCIAANINRRANIYNTLSISALILLVLNPNNLFEVGFQLSYAAVFGIVFLQPKLSKLWPVKNKVLSLLWTLLTVSIAAQITTFPITSYYFNQFPTYFWLSNLIVIPAAFALIVLGILLLILSRISLLGSVFAFITKWILKLTYWALAGIENLPYSVGEISLTKVELIFLIFALLFGFTFIESQNKKSLKAMLLSFVLLAVSTFIVNMQNLRSAELIVYNSSPNPILHIINGKTNYVVSENEIQGPEYILQQIETVRKKKKLDEITFISANDQYKDSYLFYRSGILYFAGKTIWIQSNKNKFSGQINPDLIVSTGQIKEEYAFNSQTPIISYSNRNNLNFTNIHFLKQNGAYTLKWSNNRKKTFSLQTDN